MKRLALLVALLGIVTVAQPAVAVGPGPVHQCGTFVSYQPPTATRSGELVIGATTYAAAYMGSTGSTLHTFNQVIASGVTAGSQVCLDGTLVVSQTEANLLTDFTVTLASSTNAAPRTLPSTSTDRAGQPPAPYGLLLLAALSVLVPLGFAVARIRRRSS